MRQAVVVLLLGSQLAWGAVFHDGVSNLQRTIEWMTTMTQEVKTYAETVQTAKQAVEQVQATYQMIEMAAKHLESMPLDASIVDWLIATNDQTSALLGQVQGIGFLLDQTTRQFEQLYGNTMMLTTAEGREARTRAMREARLEMTGLAMQTQSIKQTFGDIYLRLTTILGVSSWTEGQRALQQIQIQQQALLQKQQQLGLTMQAVTDRLIAMEQAEQIVREQLSDEAARRNAQQWMQGFDSVRFRGPGEGQGFQQLPK
jgi:hypothetical protein